MWTQWGPRLEKMKLQDQNDFSLHLPEGFVAMTKIFFFFCTVWKRSAVFLSKTPACHSAQTTTRYISWLVCSPSSRAGL